MSGVADKLRIPASEPAVWFPAVRAGTGTDVFTERLVSGLQTRGIRAEITWLPLRAEYAPWTVPVPVAPGWATLCHANTWLHPRFIPRHLPVVATLHHSIHDPALRPYKGALRAAYHRWWIAPIERSVMQRANQTVAVSQFAADMAVQKRCGPPLQVIYNGIDTHLFQPGNRLRHGDEPFRLLYVGSWMARKGVDLLPAVMRSLGHGYELVYTGGLSALSDARNMPANMRDIGRLSGDAAVVEAMQGADALLFPSRSEGFGLVVAEAMGCGLPVVATRSSSLVELVDDGITGLLCPFDNVEAFVESIRGLASDSDRYAAISREARRQAVERLSERAMIDAHVNLYHSILAGPGKANPPGSSHSAA